MAFLDDLKNAIANYETDNCETEIVNLSITGSVLNEGECFRFKVKVTNEGPLDMKDVAVLVLGTSYADVASDFPPMPGVYFSNSARSFQFDLDAYQSVTIGNFWGKAKKDTAGEKKDVVTARIHTWDASLAHILKDNTGAGVAEGKLNEEIVKK